MSEMEMTTEVEDFTDELSDEALDRAEGASWTGPCVSCVDAVDMTTEVVNCRLRGPVADR